MSINHENKNTYFGSAEIEWNFGAEKFVSKILICSEKLIINACRLICKSCFIWFVFFFIQPFFY